MSINKKRIATPTKYALWRMAYILVFALLTFGAGITGYFIYKTIYIGIADANTIVATNLTANTYNLDIVSFEKSTAAIMQKKQLTRFPNNTRNIFDYAQQQNISTSTTSSTQP